MIDDMPDYDPMEAPDPAWWLSLGEDERNALVLDYHVRARINLPNARAHAAFHAIVETQVAMGEELPVGRTLARLQGEGLDRHEAIHAIGSILAERLYDIMKDRGKGTDPNRAYWAALEKLSANSWRHAR